MRITGTLSAVLLSLAFAGPAAAAVIDGSYGNKEGCLYSETGESSGADVFFLLNKEGVTTAASYCAFEGQAKQVGGATVVTAQCQEAGTDETTPYELTLTPDNGGYTVSFPDGTHWGPLMRCKK
jgi:hypothetical protein